MKNVTLCYGGNFSDCEYSGGLEENILIDPQMTSIHNLRSKIDTMLISDSRVLFYDIYYLSWSQRGRVIKSRLNTDMEFSQLCMTQENPYLYVVLKIEDGTSHDDVYIPYDSQNESYINSDNHVGTSTSRFGSGNWLDSLDDIGRIVASSSWTGDIYPCDNNFTSHVDSRVPDLNMMPFNDESELDQHQNHEESDNEDEDYIEESTPESSEESSEDEQQNVLTHATIADFAAWIRTQGGIHSLLDLTYQNEDRSPNEDEEELHAGLINNWLVPVIPVSLTEALVSREEGPEIKTIGMRSYFDTKKDINIAFGLWHLEKKAEYNVVQSDKKRLMWVCGADPKKCLFELRASFHGDTWYVHSFEHHTCVESIEHVSPKMIHSKVIAAYFAKKMRGSCDIILPSAIQYELKTGFGVEISYDVTLRARNYAVEMIYGGYADSFKMLPSYLYMLEKHNPGTITDLDVGDDGKFRHLFVALGACRAAYAFCMRPVIVVDGTHLKGKNNDILFVAVTKDGNEQVYPLAYGIGPIENDVSWKWFFTRLRRSYGCTSNTLIVSDAHVSISNAVREVFTEATHGLCYYHLSDKIKKFGQVIAGLYQQAAYTYKVDEYNKRMRTIALAKPNAYTKLMEVGPAKWARSMCPIRRHSFLTSNSVESFNSRLLWPRRLPVCSCLEAIRMAIEEWFAKRRQNALLDPNPLTPQAMTKILTQKTRAGRYKVNRVTEYSFRVETSKQTMTVDLRFRTCTCMESH